VFAGISHRRFFSQFPEARPSEVPALLDAEMVKMFEDAAV
jgi:hypothetical protein